MITAINSTQSPQPSFQRWSSKPYTQRVLKALDDKLIQEGITRETHPDFYDAYTTLSGIKSKVFGPVLILDNTIHLGLTKQMGTYMMRIWMDDFERSDAYQGKYAEKLPKNRNSLASIPDGKLSPRLQREVHPDLKEDDYTLGNALFEAINEIESGYLSGLKNLYANEMYKKV